MLVFSDVRKSYRNLEVLKGLTLTVPRGALFGLMGQIGTAGIALSGFIFAFLKPELAKEGFVFSACIAGYLIWWKTRHSKQGGNEKSE